MVGGGRAGSTLRTRSGSCEPVMRILAFLAEVRVGDLVLASHETCFFFFSSRRRHTRSDRDWSSDVCSSDLTAFSVLVYNHLKRCSLMIESGMSGRRERWASLGFDSNQLNNSEGNWKRWVSQIGRASCRERV